MTPHDDHDTNGNSVIAALHVGPMYTIAILFSMSFRPLGETTLQNLACVVARLNFVSVHFVDNGAFNLERWC